MLWKGRNRIPRREEVTAAVVARLHRGPTPSRARTWLLIDQDGTRSCARLRLLRLLLRGVDAVAPARGSVDLVGAWLAGLTLVELDTASAQAAFAEHVRRARRARRCSFCKDVAIAPAHKYVQEGRAVRPSIES